MVLRKKHILFILGVFFLFFCGAVFFLIQRNWLIVQLTLGSDDIEEMVRSAKENVVLRKKVRFYYWKDDKMEIESANFIWLNNRSENLKHLVNNWLAFLCEERIINKRVLLDSVAISKDGQSVYFSFDQNPFNREWAIIDKWNFIEGMLQTIRNVDKEVKRLIFLKEGHIIEDDHLDFSQPWPVEGFC
jgi:hypothetical protein